MPATSRVLSRPAIAPRFKLGDRVLVQPEDKVGIVIGVSYGEMAFDVRCGSECLRYVSPSQIRRAPPVLSVVEASLWQWNLWSGVPRLPNGLVEVPA
jgi:hypothetical protein